MPDSKSVSRVPQVSSAMKAAYTAVLVAVALFGALLNESLATEPVAIKIRDLTSVEGVRENPLIGYGMVVGLTRTGDSQQTVFTTQTLANIMQRMGAQIPPATARVANVAAVFVTASLPAFARPGTQLDVTVSSIGDAKSLEGGLLLLTPLYGADGQVYAAAQGALAVGGYAVGGAGASKQMNHPTMGRIPAGGAGRAQSGVRFESPFAGLVALARAGFFDRGRNLRCHQP
jgi:flagellar P-ring protein precursor FlgI